MRLLKVIHGDPSPYILDQEPSALMRRQPSCKFFRRWIIRVWSRRMYE